MKKFCPAAVLLLVPALKSIGQTNGVQVFHLDRLPAKDTLLSGWKVQPGDDIPWAQPGFDDSKWQPGNSGGDVTEFKPIRQTGDCWLRLHLQAGSSLHGKRLAKDKTFNAELITHFDEKLTKINIAQQDIGRVLLNLFNNAFYAINQKQKTAGADYKPTVEITTFTSPSRGWGAKVKHNGNGIPDAVKDKIMQPFSPPNPTGEGTGLGLSLSYDIVVKGHGGKIEVDTEEVEYTVFKVLLPA